MDQSIKMWFGKISTAQHVRYYHALDWIITGPVRCDLLPWEIRIDPIDSINVNGFPNCLSHPKWANPLPLDMSPSDLRRNSFAMINRPIPKNENAETFSLVILMCLLRMNFWHNMNIFITPPQHDVQFLQPGFFLFGQAQLWRNFVSIN